MLLVAIAGCARGEGSGTGDADDGPLIVFNAGSLARPLREALDSFAAREDIRIEQENAGSLETARKITELGRTPDVIALADHEVFPGILMPDHVTWYARFARNRMVLAHTPRSRGATEIDSTNWHRIVRRADVEVGHADPNLDPAGYRTLLLYQLAERHHRQPGLADSLYRAVPARNIRPKAADLVALLQAGELDYAWLYESLARAAHLPYVALPAAIDLGDPAHASSYAMAEVRVLGAGVGDTLALRGEPIVYGISVPVRAPHPELAQRFVHFLLSADGQRILRASRLDALTTPTFTGTPPSALADPAAPPTHP